MRILLVAEGKHEQSGSLQTIVTRLSQCPLEIECARVQDTPLRIHGKGGGYFKKALAWLLQAEKRGFDAMVLLIDHDGDDERIEQFNRAQEHMEICRMPRAMGVAVRTYDAWMLADERALSQVLGQVIPTQPSPEGIRDPKEIMQELVERIANHQGLAAIYGELAKAAEFALLEQRCPRGFAPFAQRVRSIQG